MASHHVTCRGVIGTRNFEFGFESESTHFYLNPNPDSYFLSLNPNPAQKALNPDSNPNPDSDSHITDCECGVSMYFTWPLPVTLLRVA